MGQNLVQSDKRTAQVPNHLCREQLPLYNKPVPVAKILEIAQFQIQVLISEGDHLRAAITDLNLET